LTPWRTQELIPILLKEGLIPQEVWWDVFEGF